MLRNYIAPDVRPSDFLAPDGQIRSIHRVTSTKADVTQLLELGKYWKWTDVRWFAREMGYHLLWDWHDGGKSNIERERLEECMENMYGEEYHTHAQVLIELMRELVTKYGEKFYDTLLSFDTGAPEGEAGDNRMYQSSRLGECVLIGVRLGLEYAIIARWRSKLSEEDESYISRNIFPADTQY